MSQVLFQYITFASKRPQVRIWGAKLTSCPGRHLTLLRPWAGPSCKPEKQSCEKQKRSVAGSFWGIFWVAEIFGKAICLLCSKEIAEEPLKPDKLLRHVNTQKNVASLTDDGRKRVFKHRIEQLTVCRTFLRQSLTRKQRRELFSYKGIYIVAREKRPYVEGKVVTKPMLDSFVEILKVEVFQKSQSCHYWSCS